MKRQLSILLVALALVASGCGKAKPTNTTPTPEPPKQNEPAPQPTQQQPKPTDPIAGPIYLLEAPAKGLWEGPATVVIENSPQAHPQAGWLEADMVVEALSESEVTRTLAFFWSKPAAKIGPIRSARTWLVAMADAYNAPFAHSGGNNDALAVLRSEWGPANLDEIYTAGGYFYRTNDRQAPHNLYLNTDLLGRAVTERKIGMKAVGTTPRAPQAEAPKSGLVTRVDVEWHKLHAVAWEWDGKQYKRSEQYKPSASSPANPTPHLAEGGQVATPNLVLLEVQGRNDGWELGWQLFYEKGGKATVISGGTTWEGTWTLGDGGFALQPAGGAKVPPLLPGNLWVQLITPESSYNIKKGS